MTAAASHDGIAALADFVRGLQPGERNPGLFWAGCRCAEDGLEPGPLIAAAEATGLKAPEAETVIANARAHIDRARTEHEVASE